MSFAKARRLMRLVNLEALKRKLGMEGKEVIGYFELIQGCKSMGVARSNEEAAAFAQVLDEASVILLFCDKVYLHPDKAILKQTEKEDTGVLKGYSREANEDLFRADTRAREEEFAKVGLEYLRNPHAHEQVMSEPQAQAFWRKDTASIFDSLWNYGEG